MFLNRLLLKWQLNLSPVGTVIMNESETFLIGSKVIKLANQFKVEASLRPVKFYNLCSHNRQYGNKEVIV